MSIKDLDFILFRPQAGSVFERILHLCEYEMRLTRETYEDFAWQEEKTVSWGAGKLTVRWGEESAKMPDGEALTGGEWEAACLRSEYIECIGMITELCESHGFSGNLWHDILTYFLVYHENAYSRSCEIRGYVEGGINLLAWEDLAVFRKLFALDFSGVERLCGLRLFRHLKDYEPANTGRKLFNTRIAKRISLLAAALAVAEDTPTFVSLLEEFYGEYGVGKFGLHKAFRVRHIGDEVEIYPITNIAHVHLDDLVGYESAKKKLIDNTEAFVAGRRANNCLLFGDAGTGKSSSIKAILNQYYDCGLRVIEVYRHQFQDLTAIIDQIKNRNYRFIIYMDDLSFETFETEYKYLKAIIEGGLEKKPDNILIYATSNRRHLIREEYADKLIDGDDIRQDMHTSDTIQEKLSLAYRFGVTIYFGAPGKKEFQTIVKTLAAREHIEMEEEELLLLANKWELNHGGFSGRTAQQFIDYLKGFEDPNELGRIPANTFL